MSNRSQFGVILILIAFIISIAFSLNPEALLRGGYDLAIDGLVVSRTLMIIFSLYLLVKRGFVYKQKRLIV